MGHFPGQVVVVLLYHGPQTDFQFSGPREALEHVDGRKRRTRVLKTRDAVSQAVGGGAAGAVLTAIVGMIKNKAA
jgi:hypothetical protein